MGNVVISLAEIKSENRKLTTYVFYGIILFKFNSKSDDGESWELFYFREPMVGAN